MPGHARAARRLPPGAGRAQRGDAAAARGARRTPGHRPAVRGDAAAPGPARGAREPAPDRRGAGARAAHRGRRGRPACGAAGEAAVRRAHLHPPEDHAGRGGPAPLAQRRAPRPPPAPDRGALRRSPGRGAQDARDRRALRLHARRSRVPAARAAVPARRVARRRALAPHPGGRAHAVRRPRERPLAEGDRAARARAGADRQARAGRLLPDRPRHRAVLRPREGAGAGAGVGGQQRGLLRAGDHRRRPGGDEPALRALPL